MRSWQRGVQTVQRHSLQGHLLNDLFGNNRSGFYVFFEYLIALRRLLDLLEFQSNFINDYFCDLWLNRTKHMIRLAIKFFIVTCMLVVTEPAVLCPMERQVSHHLAYLAIVSFLVVYLATFRAISHESHTNLALAICLIHIATQLPIRCEVHSRNRPLLSPMFVTVFTAFVMLPIRIELCVCITIVFMVILESLELIYDNQVFRRSQSSEASIRVETWFRYDLSRVMITFAQLLKRTNKVMVVHVLLWILVCMSALYIRLWHTIRRRFAFFKLGKSVQARNQCNKAHRGKVNWIEAIMPLQVSEEYQHMRKVNDHFNVTDWVYIRTYENVSILFADIVGFTTLSSKLNALQIVALLGELITKFDELCRVTGCEKLGVLGDCYYCMAGCLELQPNHAMCCTEMGLNMCETLKKLNAEHKYAVNIRVGVHTGRVHTAILGSQRFRYDVYSYDVMIANELEATGRPGFVHISQDTYDQLNMAYTVSQGPDLVIDKKDKSFIRRRTAATVRIRTYFIEPSTIRPSFGPQQRMEAKRSNLLTSTTDRSVPSGLTWSAWGAAEQPEESSEAGSEVDHEAVMMWTDFDSSAEALADIKLSHETNAMNLKRDIAFIQDLRSDPAKHSLLFQSPPVSSVLLQFVNSELEWHYQLQMRKHLGPTFVDSEKLASVVDAIVLFIVITVLCGFAVLSTVEAQFLLAYLMILIVGLIIFMSLWLIGTNYPQTIKYEWLKNYYDFCSYPLTRELLLGIYTSLPTVVTLINRISMFKQASHENNLYLYAIMNYMSVLVHALPSSSAAWARTLFCSLCAVCLTARWTINLPNTFPQELCLNNVTLLNGLPANKVFLVHNLQLAVCVALVTVLARESERVSKLCFFVHREAEIESEAAEKAVSEANDLLYNIIPAYVFEELNETGRADFTVNQSTLRYAVGHSNVGVVFASVSNFFTTLYREDQGGGERSLRLLHQIICSFDELLRKPDYKDVEKIKSMHENYLVAAGLNRKLLAMNTDPLAHLVALMNYCFELRRILQSFQTYELKETGPLVPKLGFNCGPLTAGIIGTEKPHYDIWGDTVNVASRMCYTSMPGPVQVTQWVKDKLDKRFPFEYRGSIFVKGKGMMQTYFCEEVKQTEDSQDENAPLESVSSLQSK